MAVESANTVGFIDKVADADVYTPVAVMFGDVGVNTLAIDSIVFDGIARGDSLQIFGNDGNVATELIKTKNGWNDDNDDDASDWVFQPGDAFWINACHGVDIDVEIPAPVLASN